jgi:hypothetical protein
MKFHTHPPPRAFGASSTTPGFRTTTTPTFGTSTTTGTAAAPVSAQFPAVIDGGFGARVSAIREDARIGDIKVEDAAEGQRQIVFIFRVQQEYENVMCAARMEGQEAFDLRPCAA